MRGRQMKQRHPHRQRRAGRASPPQQAEDTNEIERVLRLEEAHLIAPAPVTQELDADGQPARQIAEPPQARRGLLQQPMQDRLRQRQRSVLRLQHMRVPHRAALGGRAIQFLAPQQRVHPVAFNPVPGPAQDFLRRPAKLLHGSNAARVQPGFPRPANPAKIAQFQPEKHPRQIGLLDHHQAVGLLHVGGRLGQERIGRNADRAAQALAHRGSDPRLDLAGELQRRLPLLPRPAQGAAHLVDGKHLCHRHARIDGGDQPVMVVDIDRRARFHHHQPRASLARLARIRARLDAEPFRFIARGDATRAVGHDRQDDHRQSAQGGLFLLLHGGEVGIEIDYHHPQGHGPIFARGQIGRKKIIRLYYLRRPLPQIFSSPKPPSLLLRLYNTLTRLPAITRGQVVVIYCGPRL